MNQKYHTEVYGNRFRVESFTLMHFVKALLTVLGLVVSIVSFSQSEELLITGRFKIDGGTNKDATITLEKDGRKVKTIAGESRFEVGLDYQAVYIVSFEKEGYVTKRIRFDTHVLPERIEYGFVPFDFTVEIFEQFDDINVVMFNQPVGKIAFSELIDEFDYDTDYTQSIQARLDQVMEEVEEKKEEKIAEEEAKAEAEKQLNEDVKDFIEEAEKNISSGNPQEAIKNLEEAAKLKDSPEIQQKLEEATKQLEQQAKQKEQEEQANKLIAEAEAAMAGGDLNDARKKFEQAAALMENDKRIKNGLDQVNTLIEKKAEEENEFNGFISGAEEALNAGNLPEAIKLAEEALKLRADEKAEEIKSEALEKQEEIQLAEAKQKELNDQVEELVSGAKDLEKEGDLEGAIEKLGEANGLKPSAEITSKIDELNATLTANNIAEEEAAAKELEFNRLLESANSAFDAGDLVKAKSEALKAQAIDPDPVTDLLKKIEDAEKAEASKLAAAQEEQAEYDNSVKRADEALNTNDLEKAEEEITKALTINPDGEEAIAMQDLINDKKAKIKQEQEAAQAEEEAKKTEFETLLNEGDQALDKNDLMAAKEAYTKAGELFEDKRVDKGLKAVEEKIAEQAAAELAATESAAKYEEALSAGDLAFSEDRLDDAMALYKVAQNIEDKPEIAEKILAVDARKKEIEELKADEAAKAAEEQAAKEAEEMAAKEKAEQEALEAEKEAAKLTDLEKQAEALAKKQSRVDELLGTAKEDFEKGELNKALKNYQEANSLIPSPEIEQKIADVKALISEQAALAEANENEKTAKEEQAKAMAQQKALIDKADKKLSKNNLDGAEADLIAAKEFGDNPEIDTRLAQLETKRKEALDLKLAAETEAENQDKEKERQSQFDDLIKSGDKKLKADNLEGAKTDFEAAISLFPNEEYPVNKLEEINERLSILADEQKEQEKAELEKAALEKRRADEQAAAEQAKRELEEKEMAEKEAASLERAKREKEKEINDLVSRGDELVKAGKLKLALDEYEKAQALESNSDVQGKIDQVNRLIDRKLEEHEKSKEAAQAMSNGPKESDELASIIEEESNKQVNNDVPNPTKITESLNVETKPVNRVTTATAVMESDERPMSVVKGGAVQISQSRVGKETLNSPAASMSEEDIYDGVLNKVEEDQNKMIYEEEQRRLKAKYPERKTVETEKEGTSTITYVYINRGEFVNVYKKVEHNWGGVFYFVDGQATNARFWQHETQ